MPIGLPATRVSCSNGTESAIEFLKVMPGGSCILLAAENLRCSSKSERLNRTFGSVAIALFSAVPGLLILGPPMKITPIVEAVDGRVVEAFNVTILPGDRTFEGPSPVGGYSRRRTFVPGISH